MRPTNYVLFSIQIQIFIIYLALSVWLQCDHLYTYLSTLVTLRQGKNLI